MNDMEPQSNNLMPPGQVDHEGAMAKADLYKIANYSVKLFKKIDDNAQMEAWVQAKITKAADYVASVYHYLEYEMKFTEFGAKLENAEMYSESERVELKNKLNEAKEMLRILKLAQAQKLDEAKSPKAKKDWDGDGKIESDKDEVWGSRMKAAKKAGKMKESWDDDDEDPDVKKADSELKKKGVKLPKVKVDPDKDFSKLAKKSKKEDDLDESWNDDQDDINQLPPEHIESDMPVAWWYEHNGDQIKITSWLKHHAGFRSDVPLYFDDADLVFGSKTIVPYALVKNNITFGDMLDVVQKIKSKKRIPEGSGPYQLSDPKHPKFKANYEKFKKANPDKKLADFVDAMKKKDKVGLDESWDDDDEDDDVKRADSELKKRGVKLPKVKHKEVPIKKTAKDKEEELDEGKKPDFLDLDKDGDKKEPMKKAAKEKKLSEVSSDTLKGYQKKVVQRVLDKKEPVEKRRAGFDKAEKMIPKKEKGETAKSLNIDPSHVDSVKSDFKKLGKDLDIKNPTHHKMASTIAKKYQEEAINESADLARMKEFLTRLNG